MGRSYYVRGHWIDIAVGKTTCFFSQLLSPARISPALEDAPFGSREKTRNSLDQYSFKRPRATTVELCQPHRALLQIQVCQVSGGRKNHTWILDLLQLAYEYSQRFVAELGTGLALCVHVVSPGDHGPVKTLLLQSLSYGLWVMGSTSSGTDTFC